MIALIITLTGVIAWFVGWFMVARYRVELWHRRGDRICVGSELVRVRRFSQPEDRGYIAFYALLVTVPWPVVLVGLLMYGHLFNRLDRREATRLEAERRRRAEVGTWRATLNNPDASEVERRVAAEVLRSLGEKVSS